MKNPRNLLVCSFLIMAASAEAATIAEWNFNTNGNSEGWAVGNNITGLTTSGGFLSGTASNGDPQLVNSPLNLSLGAGQSWQEVVFRVRETPSPVSFSPTGLVVQFNGGGMNGVNLYGSVGTAVDSGNGFQTVTVDVSGLGTGTTVTSLRIDPIGGPDAAGSTFDLDFIRLTATDPVAAIPEPSAFLLGVLGLLGLLRRRR